MANTSPSEDTWIYDHLHKSYFHPLSNTYAIPDPNTAQWNYIPADQVHNASTSATNSGYNNSTIVGSEKEEGEIEDDMGWGGLMEPEKLAQIEKDEKIKPMKSTKQPLHPTVPPEKEKHPAYVVPYDDPALYAYPSQPEGDEADQEKPTKERPNDTLRLVVMGSGCLEVGQVAILDTREGGIQLGRDRCEKGGQARVRLKEMEVSKTHAVIYWGTGGDDESSQVEELQDWWIVDLGSTHGTFLSQPMTEDATRTPKLTRLSEPKHSSRPHRVTHLSRLRIGTSEFSLHIHPSWPCDQCQVNGTNEIPLDDGQPKLIPAHNEEVASENDTPPIYAMDSSQKKQNRELKRKREMASLRESLLRKDRGIHVNGRSEGDQEDSRKREYLDRSAMRRKLHPPSPPPHSTKGNTKMASEANTPERSSPPVSIQTPDASKGTFIATSIMEKQGWTPGMGLGKSSQGISEAIQTEMRNEKKGLGAKGSKAIVNTGPGDWKMRAKQRRWEEMQGSGK
ncbi:uncharacterized protein I206_107738 [Kwoniella pini CBS 10737]|uniref:G-patch domain-containing protein n=1 Tax=Kwoniella pini CBS 10737 TaxID=1296096 RepID=A0A1B9HY60_9TREE|nr:uncharacterized protein I206_06072 [Kwoniella pini CBS 10737]OCF48204.1 hypothetical protein I206_06072 [Kwoniella pini CBS 10737]